MKLDENGNIVNEAPEVSMDELSDFINDDPTPIAPVETPAVENVEDKKEGEVKVETPVELKPEGEETTGNVETMIAPIAPVVPVMETPEFSELDALKAQNAKLVEQLEKLAGGSKAETKTEVKAEAVATPTLPSSPDIDALVDGVDFDSIMENKVEFIKFMKTALNAVREDAVQRTLVSMPQVVGSFVQRQTSLRDVATQFYTAHPELKRVKQYVTHVANQVSAEHPDWTIVQVLEETAKGVKETLQLKAEVDTAAKVEVGKPSLPGGTKVAKTPTAPSSGLQKEIDDLIND